MARDVPTRKEATMIRNREKKGTKKEQGKSPNVRRETIRNLTNREQKGVRGGAGAPSGVIGDRSTRL